MHRILITGLLLVLFISNGLSQDIENYSLKYEKREIVKGQLINSQKTGDWFFKSFNGDILISGQYADNKKNGKWMYYDNNKLLSEFYYQNNLKNGNCIGYYKSGAKAYEKSFINGKQEGKRISYFKKGPIRKIGFYSEGVLDSIIEYDKKGNLILNGKIKNGLKQGKWIYEDSTIIHSVIDSVEYEEVKAEVLVIKNRYIVTERMPEFPNGEEGLISYLQSNLQELDIPKEHNKSGKVIISFKINEIGETCEFEIVQGLNDYIDNKVIKLIKNMPNWMSGLQSGEPVKVAFRIPIIF